ncbi:hypothetical protein BDQ17DRAFT_1430612 [Cyathus striatus]|nr:hypothetical protein BDQ17DRAFT_1430612 [Cyathus striatus]
MVRARPSNSRTARGPLVRGRVRPQRVFSENIWKHYKPTLFNSSRIKRKTIHIPDDVLREIFGYALHLHGEVINIGEKRGRVWDLGQVCGQWRAVIQDSPSFWSSFKISEINIRPRSVIHRIKLCLEYSRTSLLSISLLPSRSSEAPPIQSLEDIAKHTDRVMSLSINETIFNKMMENGTSANLFRQKGFGQLIKLTMDVYGSYFSLNNMLGCLAFPWTSVKNLNLKHVDGTVGQFMTIIGALSSTLEELTWGSNFVKNENLGSEKAIVLPSLHTLNILGDHDDGMIWRLVHVPNLIKVYIGNVYNRYKGEVLNMINRSKRATKRLNLGGCSSLPCFRHLSEVQVLTFNLRQERQNSRDMLRSLIWDYGALNQNINSFPSLQILKINMGKINNIITPQDTIIDYVNWILPDIMRSRSSHVELPAHLVTVIFKVECLLSPASKYYIPYFKRLENLGQELGITVAFCVEGYQPCYNREDEDIIDDCLTISCIERS